MRTARLVRTAFALAVPLLVSCGRTPVQERAVCIAGESVACVCTSGRTGAQVCESGLRFGPCICDDACVPGTCASLQKDCGSVPDGCGGYVSCGLCGQGEVCGGGGSSNVCGTASCVPATCAGLEKNCGVVSDGCGSILSCGTCGSGTSCGGGGIPNVCGSSCKPRTCASAGAGCGTIADGCGGTLFCGGCAPGESCGGGGAPNVCSPVCVPATCDALGKNCGSVADGCGGTLNCGSCKLPATCGGGGTANVCACATTTCEAPTQLSATVVAVTSVQLVWTDNASTEVGFEIERGTSPTSFAAHATVGANLPNFLDTGLPAGSTFSYRVRATLAGNAHSAWSNVASVQLPVGNSWPTIGGNPQHTGHNAVETGTPPLSPAWTAPVGTSSSGPVVVEAGRVFFSKPGGSAPGGEVIALHASTGAQLWSYGTGSGNFSQGMLAVSSGRVYLQTCDHSPGTKLHAVDASTGDALWTIPFSAQWERYWSPIVHNGNVYINGGYYGGLYGFDAITGAQLFFVGLKQYDEWSPAASGGSVFSFTGGDLKAHDPLTGAVQWTASIPWNWAGWSMRTVPVIGAGKAFVIAPPNLWAVDLASHGTAWSTTGLAFTGSPSYANGTVFGLTGGNLRALDASNGTLKWVFVGDGALSYPAVSAAGYVYVASANNVYAVDAVTGTQVWTAAGGGWLSIAEGKLFVSKTNGQVVAYALTP